jgi:ubiquinone/menaquinone biosynthesis C-methylase UbiE
MPRFPKRPRPSAALCGVLLLATAASFAHPAPTPPAYESIPASKDGIGIRYMGREIAHVMGWQAADWLERVERQAEERTDLLVEELHLAPGMRVADVGAGTGYVSRRIARAVGPQGRVEAVDVQPQMVEKLAQRAQSEGLSQLHPVLGAEDDVRLAPNSVDLAIMVDVYHELAHPYEMLASIVRAVRPGGRVVFVEYRAEDPAVPIKPLHTMSVAQVTREAQLLPLHLERVAEPLPWQHIIVFRKEGAAPTDAGLPVPLRTAIAATHPGMHVLGAEEARYTGCAPAAAPGPAWIAADFNGDGRTDYAVLLVSDEATWTVRFDNQDYPTYAARVVAYLGQADGGLREREVYAFQESLPTIRGIAVQGSSAAGSGGEARMRHAGITFISCGQFAVTYYWTGDGFEHAAEPQ